MAVSQTPWVGQEADKLYNQSGQFESTIKDSISIQAVDDLPKGVGWDGTNSPWCGSEAQKLYLQSGRFSATLKTSITRGAVDNNPIGITSDVNVDSPWVGNEADKLYLQSGQFSATMKTSLDVSGVDNIIAGIDVDSTNTSWEGVQANKLYLQSGQFSATLKTSWDYTGIDAQSLGIGADRTNTPWAGNGDDKLYLQSGQFSATLKTSLDVSGIDNTPYGISSGDYNDRITAAPTTRNVTGTCDMVMSTSASAQVRRWRPAAFENTHVDFLTLGVGYTSALPQRFTVGSDDGAQYVTLTHDDANVLVNWSIGDVVWTTDETNGNSTYQVRGNGTGVGTISTWDEDNGEYAQMTCTGGYARFKADGTTPVGVDMQPGAEVPIIFFRSASESETQEIKIYGFRTGDSSRALEIGVGVDAADTASFDGLSNYSFDGNLILPKASGSGIKIDRAAATFGWADLQGNVTNSKGATKPTEATYRGGITEFQFSAGDDAAIEYHIPHDYVPGTDIHLHVHWSHIGTFVTGGTLTFTVESSYAKGHNQAAFSSPVTGTFTGNASTTQYQHIVSETQYSASSPSGLQVDTDNLEPDGIILMRLEMTTNSITVSEGAVPDPFIHHIDIHYQTTGVIGTKQKAPNFYT
jgi:hypothetical protein